MPLQPPSDNGRIFKILLPEVTLNNRIRSPIGGVDQGSRLGPRCCGPQRANVLLFRNRLEAK